MTCRVCNDNHLLICPACDGNKGGCARCRGNGYIWCPLCIDKTRPAPGLLDGIYSVGLAIINELETFFGVSENESTRL